jgi:hypothetical protein
VRQVQDALGGLAARLSEAPATLEERFLQLTRPVPARTSGAAR